jgi:hypothetical protein
MTLLIVVGDRLNKELKAILAADVVKKLLLDNGMEEDYLGPTEFGHYFLMLSWSDDMFMILVCCSRHWSVLESK